MAITPPATPASALRSGGVGRVEQGATLRAAAASGAPQLTEGIATATAPPVSTDRCAVEQPAALRTRWRGKTLETVAAVAATAAIDAGAAYSVASHAPIDHGWQDDQRDNKH